MILVLFFNVGRNHEGTVQCDCRNIFRHLRQRNFGKTLYEYLRLQTVRNIFVLQIFLVDKELSSLVYVEDVTL